MSTPFDLLLFGRQKLAAATGSSPSQQSLTKARVRIVQQVFNNRKLVYRNRVETNRQNLVVSTIESGHRREQATQRLLRENILHDLKRSNTSIGDCLTLLPYYEPIDLTEPKNISRDGARIQSASTNFRSHMVPLNLKLDDLDRTGKKPHAKSASTLFRSNGRSMSMCATQKKENDSTRKSISALSTIQTHYSNECTTSDASGEDCCQNSSELPSDNCDVIKPDTAALRQRVDWPIRLKVFSLQDDNEVRQQFLAWRAEKRKAKNAESLKQKLDIEMEKKYQEAIRRKAEIEAFITPDLVEDHKAHDPIFAKRYRQLQLAVRTGKVPNYDMRDRDINTSMTKSKLQRARTALITAKQSQLEDLDRQKQVVNNTNLSKRIDTFLKHFSMLSEENIISM